MNPHFAELTDYPFIRLAELFSTVSPPNKLTPISLAIGEPKHEPPSFLLDAITEFVSGVKTYPPTRGQDVLRSACAQWLEHRFDLPEGSVDPATQVLPLNGSREGLFSIVQTVINRELEPFVVIPNPFYQIYEGATLFAGAKPYFVDLGLGIDAMIDSTPKRIWQNTSALFVCSPDNPTGRTLTVEDFEKLIKLAQTYDFVLISDECYAEIYCDESKPPAGLLQACHTLGNPEYKRCVVFHSLSKRSNVPGLRSGFAAGDGDIMKAFLQYRIFAGGAMPTGTQMVSALAWQDHNHVLANRQQYREKFEAVVPILNKHLDVQTPDGSFYLWPNVPVDDELFCKTLYAQQNVKVVPGSYLARDTKKGNPGKNHLRLSLVAETAECVEAAQRIVQTLETF